MLFFIGYFIYFLYNFVGLNQGWAQKTIWDLEYLSQT